MSKMHTTNEKKKLREMSLRQ